MKRINVKTSIGIKTLDFDKFDSYAPFTQKLIRAQYPELFKNQDIKSIRLNSLEGASAEGK